MQNFGTTLLGRNDTLLGVCAGIGEDFGFNPDYLRVALAVMLLWSPVGVFAAYAALGVLVLLSRVIFPRPRAKHEAPALAAEALPVEANDGEAPALPVAA